MKEKFIFYISANSCMTSFKRLSNVLLWKSWILWKYGDLVTLVWKKLEKAGFFIIPCLLEGLLMTWGIFCEEITSERWHFVLYTYVKAIENPLWLKTISKTKHRLNLRTYLKECFDAKILGIIWKISTAMMVYTEF